MTQASLVRAGLRAAFVSGVFLTATSAASAERLTPLQRLGQALYSDEDLSLNRNQSCESCHALERVWVRVEVAPGRHRYQRQPAAGFVDPDNVQHGTSVSDGSVPGAVGALNSPSVGYAAFSPAFHWNEDDGLFFGGQFWNGRAASLEAQAAEPFLSAGEMALPSTFALVERLREKPRYRWAFRWLFGLDLSQLEAEDAEVAEAFEGVTRAIAAFERSRRFNRFDSKFDFEGAGLAEYTEAEARGAELFDGKAMCSACHPTEGIDGEGSPALLTDFSYDNLGVPENPWLPLTSNDPGLLGNPELLAARGGPTPREEVEGRHKVMSLRNIALTAPYMHNGLFETLELVVHFYNTRDVLPKCENPADATNPGFGVTCWPRGEFHDTRNTSELGDLGLTSEEEADLVAYLRTFTDNYPSWGNRAGLRDPNVRPGTPSPYADYPVPGPVRN